MQGNGKRSCAVDKILYCAESAIERIAFGRHGKIDDGLGQGEIPFGRTHKTIGVHGSECKCERSRVRQPHVFRCEPHHSARDIERILSRFKHPSNQ